MSRGFLCLSKVFPHAYYLSSTLHFFGKKHWFQLDQIKYIWHMLYLRGPNEMSDA